jgi:hypothetical protein
LKKQVEAAMIFNGHTQESIAALDVETMKDIQTMYADGMVGNHNIIHLLGSLATGIFNYLRSDSAAPFSLAKILGPANDYIYPPMSEEQKKAQANEQLLAFMTMAPGFNKERFSRG